MQLLMVLSMLLATKIAAQKGPYDIPYDGLNANEKVIDIVLQNVPADLDFTNYHCVDASWSITDPANADLKIRAYTVLEYPAQGHVTYSVRSLGIRPTACDVYGQPAEPGTEFSVPCQFSSADGGPEGRVELSYQDTRPGLAYQACAAGSLQGYKLLLAVYRRDNSS